MLSTWVLHPVGGKGDHIPLLADWSIVIEVIGETIQKGVKTPLLHLNSNYI